MQTYTLYGAYASFYTAKTRSYLRKKGIPFIERLPSDPRFRNHVSPVAHSKRIPILEAPDGTIVQDTTEIFEFLEARHPQPPALPPEPRQRLTAYLIDLFASENSKIAWHFRWNFQEENFFFVTREFGRSFAPRGSDAALDRYGALIARRMDGHRARLGITPALYPVMQEVYFDLLDILERQFMEHPFLLGGLPSIGDFALMGPLFAHLGRDPYPLHLMQQRAPRVFRWVEHMNTPEIEAPEFANTAQTYLPDDHVPEATRSLLARCCADYAPVYLETAQRFGAWLKAHPGHRSRAPISAEGADQPSFGEITVPLRGGTMTMQSQGHSLWLLQRTLDWFSALDEAARAKVRDFAQQCGAGELLGITLPRRLARVDNRLALG